MCRNWATQGNRCDRHQEADAANKTETKSVEYEVTLSPPLNFEKARHLLNTRGFSQRGAPTFGCLSYPACVEALAKRAMEVAGLMHTKDLWSESEVAQQLGLKMRLYPVSAVALTMKAFLILPSASESLEFLTVWSAFQSHATRRCSAMHCSSKCQIWLMLICSCRI